MPCGCSPTPPEPVPLGCPVKVWGLLSQELHRQGVGQLGVDSLLPSPSGPAPLRRPGKVCGLVFQVLQSMRDRYSFPTLMAYGASKWKGLKWGEGTTPCLGSVSSHTGIHRFCGRFYKYAINAEDKCNLNNDPRCSAMPYCLLNTVLSHLFHSLTASDREKAAENPTSLLKAALPANLNTGLQTRHVPPPYHAPP